MTKVSFSALLATALFCSLFLHACQKDNIATPAVDKKATVGLDAGDRCMCLPPYTIGVSETGSTTAMVTWDEMPESIGYQVEWFNGNEFTVVDPSMLSVEFTEGNSMQLSNLTPGRQYAVRVINLCRINNSLPPGWVVFQTAPKAVINPKIGANQN